MKIKITTLLNSMAISAMLLLSGCPGFFFAVPVGPVVIGTGADAGGDVYVGGTAAAASGSVSTAIRLPKQQHDTPFTDDPYVHDSSMRKQQEEHKKEEQ